MFVIKALHGPKKGSVKPLQFDEIAICLPDDRRRVTRIGKNNLTGRDVNDGQEQGHEHIPFVVATQLIVGILQYFGG